jgi:hypothetical protein
MISVFVSVKALRSLSFCALWQIDPCVKKLDVIRWHEPVLIRTAGFRSRFVSSDSMTAAIRSPVEVAAQSVGLWRQNENALRWMAPSAIDHCW